MSNKVQIDKRLKTSFNILLNMFTNSTLNRSLDKKLLNGKLFTARKLNRSAIFALSLLLTTILAGCTSPSLRPVFEEKDSGPASPVDVSHIKEPIPRIEPRTPAGNSSPYSVLGQTYKVNQAPIGFREQGVASWYGKKFHGRRTANGELYNMYGMTAAHRTLPIPSYVKVTNLKNQRSVVVRINDRGPFHGNRIIDLTYTAAKKLGYEKVGTANVVIEYIDPTTYQPSSTQLLNTNAGDGTIGTQLEPAAPTPENSAGYAIPNNTYLQIGAFTAEKSAHDLRDKLRGLTSYPVIVRRPVQYGAVDKFFRVRIGPLRDNLDLVLLREKVLSASLPEPLVVYD